MIELEWSEVVDGLDRGPSANQRTHPLTPGGELAPGGELGPVALTVGVFDGIHLGHRELISRITGADSLCSVVVTFRRLPSETLPGKSFPGRIMSSPQKRDTLASLGVDVLILVDFSDDFRLLSGRAFLDQLRLSLDLRVVVLGHDFRCGHNMDTDASSAYAYLRDNGVDARIIDAVSADEDLVSSTRIRQSILDGDLHQASTLLGSPFSLDLSGEQVAVDGSWRRIGLSAGRILPVSQQLTPRPGSYTGEFVLESPRAGGPEPGTLYVEEKSLSWQLPESATIRYIVLRTRRM